LFDNLKALSTGLGGEYVTFIDYDFSQEGAAVVPNEEVVKTS
jgi:hypothetical protein